MLYMMYYDDSKAPLASRVESAIRMYRERFGVQPSKLLISEADYATLGREDVDGVPLYATATVHKNNFWAGINNSSVIPS